MEKGETGCSQTEAERIERSALFCHSVRPQVSVLILWLPSHISLSQSTSLREDIKGLSTRLATRNDKSKPIWGGPSGIGEDILEQIKQGHQWQRNLEIALTKIFESDQGIPLLRAPKDDKGKIVFLPWQRLPVADSLFHGLLQQLDFSEISIREERVAEAHLQTFEWIFSEPSQKIMKWHSFIDWLREDGHLYWITGKAGSGKSTLMKFILQDSRTRKHLQVWAKDSHLVVASYYFWLAGTEQLQHSEEGLMRTLLYQALTQLKEVAPETALAKLNTFALFKDFQKPWTWIELEQAFRSILDNQSTSIKYCFIIDGLDEIKADLSSLLSFIRKISKYPNIKVCISSRPWFIFGDEFSTKPHLMLQDLTESDIKIYITSKFDSNVAFRELQIMDVKIAESLIEEIARKSSGVFLWVVLVLLSLEEGLRDGDRLSDLQRKLDALPPELENLFRQILHNFDPRYMKQPCTLFRIVKSALCPLSLLCLSLADEENTNLAVQAKAEPKLFFPRQRFYRVLNMRRRLDSRCKGLLEAAPVWINENHISSCDTLPANDLIIVEQQEDTPGVVVTIAPDDGKTGNAAILRDFSTLPADRGDLLADANVEYLHRTVKDFLEQPDVWQQVLAATDTNFQPHLALARSYVLQLKWVHFNPPAVVPRETWNAIFWIIEYCALAEASNEVDVELLDEVGRTLRMWFRPPASPDWPPSSDWPPSVSSLKDFKRWPINPEQGPADFLHLAVQCGLRL